MRLNYLPVWLFLLGITLLLNPGCARKAATDTAVGSDFDKNKRETKTPQADKPEHEKPPQAEAKADPPPTPNPVPTPVSDGNGTLLRLNHPLGKPLIYDVTFNRKMSGPSKFTETNSYYLYTFSNKKVDNLDLLSMVRSYTARNRDDVYENKKKVLGKILPMAPESVDLGPNFQVIGNQRCYAFDGQNNIAYRTDYMVELTDGSSRRGNIVRQEDKTLDENSITLETSSGQVMIPKANVKQIFTLATPHIVAADNVHFFFPILSRKPVEPGQSWAFKVPVLVPLGESQNVNMSTYFDVRVKCTLKELSGSGDHQVALIEYQFSGLFDTAVPDYAARFGQDFLNANHISTSVEGSGSMRMNVGTGIMLDKSEQAKISSSTSSQIPQPENQPPKEVHQEVIYTNSFTMKWLPPGTLLKDKTKVPPME